MDQQLIARARQLKAQGDPRLAKIDLDALEAGSLNPEQILEAVIAILSIFFSGNAFVVEIIALLEDIAPILAGGSGTLPLARLGPVGLGPTPYAPWPG